MSINKSLASVVCIASLFLIAAQVRELKFVTQTDLPNAGLRIMLMPGAKEVPIQPPASRAVVRRTSDGQEKSVDVFSPRELWIEDQHIGKWTDGYDNVLTLATVKNPVTVRFPYDRITREEYHAVIAEAAKEDIPWESDALVAWVTCFFGANSVRPESITNPPPNIEQLARYYIEGESATPRQVVYSFQLNRKAMGQGKASRNHYVAFFQVADTIPMDSAQKAIDKMFLRSVTSARTTLSKEAGPSSAFRNPNSPMFTRLKDRSPEFIASREQVINSVKNMSDWWFVETDNYIILSDLKQRHKAMVIDLQNKIELLRDGFQQFMPPPKEITAVSIIRIFGLPEEYESYVGPKYAWSGGLWMSSRKELVIKPADWGGKKEQKEEVLRVAFHEAFHQYLFYAMDRLDTACWFNEGHACFFEAAMVNERKLTVEEHKYRDKELEDVLRNKAFSLDTLLGMEDEQFYSGMPDEISSHYAMAWGLVYYLRKWAPLDKTKPAYANILGKYIEALLETKDGRKATEMAFAGIDRSQFQADFLKFWNSQSMRSKARQNKIFKDYDPKRR